MLLLSAISQVMCHRALLLKHQPLNPPSICFTPIGLRDHLIKDVSTMATRRHIWMLMLQLTCFRLLMPVVSIPFSFLHVFFSSPCYLTVSSLLKQTGSAYFAWNYNACMGELENTCARGEQSFCSIIVFCRLMSSSICLAVYSFVVSGLGGDK